MQKERANHYVSVVYSGQCIRRYMERNDLSFVRAARLWGINKNVIGNAVRKDKLTINSIIKIHKATQLPISDFFCLEEDNSVSLTAYLNGMKEGNNETIFLDEPEFKYKKCENLEDEKALLAYLQKEEGILLKRLCVINEHRNEVLKEHPEVHV